MNLGKRRLLAFGDASNAWTILCPYRDRFVPIMSHNQWRPNQHTHTPNNAWTHRKELLYHFCRDRTHGRQTNIRIAFLSVLIVHLQVNIAFCNKYMYTLYVCCVRILMKVSRREFSISIYSKAFIVVLQTGVDFGR